MDWQFPFDDKPDLPRFTSAPTVILAAGTYDIMLPAGLFRALHEPPKAATKADQEI